MTIYDIWFTAVFGTNCANAQKIADYGKSPQQLYEMAGELPSKVFSRKQVENAKTITLDDVRDSFTAYEKYGVSCVTYMDENFPKRMENFQQRPLILYYKGNLSLLSADYTVGIVGSRHFSSDSEKATEIIAKDVAVRGGVVISGLAQGVDVTAHNACVNAGGKTVAVLGTEITKFFPLAHKEIQENLEKDNLVISEYIHGTEYHGSNFVNRNRIIAAASDGLCVIQAAERSGSLSTARRTLELDRQLFVVPASPFAEKFAGSNNLLYEKLATAVKDGNQIMSSLGAVVVKKETKKEQAEQKKIKELSQAALDIFTAIKDGDAYTSAIRKKTGYNSSKISICLSELQIAGLVKRADDGSLVAVE